MRGEHELGAQPGQVTGGPREDADPAFVGGAEVGDVDVAVPPLLTAVPGRDQTEREVDRVGPAARQPSIESAEISKRPASPAAYRTEVSNSSVPGCSTPNATVRARSDTGSGGART